MGRLKHSKKRNVGLVYELLVRTVSDAVIGQDPSRAAVALDIIERHLSPGKTLRDDLDVHRSVMESRGVSASVARRIIDELRAAGIRLGARRGGDAARTALIHEVNRRLGPATWDLRVKDYVAHASVGLVLARSLAGRLDEGPEYARVEEGLVQFLTTEDAAPVAVDRDESRYAYDVARNLYQEGYGRELDAEQAELLREFIRWQFGGPVAPLERTVDRHRGVILDALRSHRSDDEFLKDDLMRTSLEDAISELSGPRPPVDEPLLERMMMLHDLRREVLS